MSDEDNAFDTSISSRISLLHGYIRSDCAVVVIVVDVTVVGIVDIVVVLVVIVGVVTVVDVVVVNHGDDDTVELPNITVNCIK